MRLLPKIIFACSVLLAPAAVNAADALAEPRARLNPQSIQTRSEPGPVKLALDAAPASGRELTTATSVFVGAERITPSARDATSVTFVPPQLEVGGDAEVRVVNAANEVLALGRLRYVDAPRAFDRPVLAIVYALMILGLPLSLMLLDMGRAYKFAEETRTLIIGKAAADGLTADELKLLLAELSESPPGIPGLARNCIAFMLMMILGVAIVHILAVDPPGAKDIPASIDRILVLLTGLLTSVVSFYFGSRASEKAATKAASSTTSSEEKPASEPLTFVPKSAKPGDLVTISGAGFGAEQGTVMFGELAADIADAQWSDKEVKVKVPADAKPGKVQIVLIPKGSDKKLISTTQLEVSTRTGELADVSDDENAIDGCDVRIEQPTPDEELPAAEGGLAK